MADKIDVVLRVGKCHAGVCSILLEFYYQLFVRALDCEACREGKFVIFNLASVHRCESLELSLAFFWVMALLHNFFPPVRHPLEIREVLVHFRLNTL